MLQIRQMKLAYEHWLHIYGVHINWQHIFHVDWIKPQAYYILAPKKFNLKEKETKQKKIIIDDIREVVE